MKLFNNTNIRTAMVYTNAVGDKVYPVIVDIKKGIKSTEEILFVSSDINTGILSVAFIQGNDTYNVTGAEVVCSIMRPDASTLDIPCTVIENNIVEVPLGVNGTSQDGVYSFDFKVFKGGNKVVGTSIMNYSVSLSISNDNAVLEDDRLPVLTMLMTQLTELKGEARETINQSNAATVSSREATANAIAATNNANAVSERVSQEYSEAISRVDNKVNEVETRFNALTSSQQQDAEVIDARDGETSLKARLDRDIEKTNKELDKIKKLEESTVSTVETESDFTTVEATSGGYFEDVKLEGKTLVNLPRRQVSYYPSGVEAAKIVSDSNVTCYEYEIKPNTTYTIKKDEISNRGTVALFSSNSVGSVATKTVINMISDGKISTIRTGNEDKYMLLYVNSTLISSGVKTTVLEGDHTQNPPSFFEGLKSVGEDVDEIVVSSVNGDGNLFGFEVKKFNCSSTGWYDVQGVPNMYSDMSEKTQCQVYLPAGTYTVGYDGVNSINVSTFQLVSIDDKVVVNANSNENFKSTKFLNEGVYTIRVRPTSTGEVFVKDVQILKGDTLKPYTPHQSDKKRLLYYNEETQTWEKPILRQWDSIEKHANGKYYYHQRSGEVVLNGSESWAPYESPNSKNVCGYYAGLNCKVGVPYNIAVCDKLTSIYPDAFPGNVSENAYVGCIYVGGSDTGYVKIATDITTLAGFKQWLQANNVTVVYQLAEEKVYECTNIDLITYEGETNYIVESGAIVPKSILKVHNNISNVVKILQEKVSILESNVKASQEVQDMMILETDMRMLDIELALMEFMPMTLNLGGNSMLRSTTYFNFVKNHIINETYEKEYLENVMNKYLATGRINQDEYDELYKMLYPPVYDIELPIEL